MSDRLLERQYSKCRALIAEAIVAGFRLREPAISEYFPYSQALGPKQREVSGVGAYVDSTGTLLLYLRSFEEGLPGSVVAQDPSAWKHCILDSADDELPLAVTRCCEWIESWAEPDEEVDPIGASQTMFNAISHLLAMAAAEALLSRSVQDELHRQSILLRINELETNDAGSVGHRFVVRERDDRFSCNYCDFVAAQRYTAYVFSGNARREAKRELTDEASFQEEKEDFFRDTGVRIGERATMSQLRAWLRWVINRKS